MERGLVPPFDPDLIFLTKPWASVLYCCPIFRPHSFVCLHHRLRSVSMGSSSVSDPGHCSFEVAYMPCSVFWGTALVLFLAKWINVHNSSTQDFWQEICEQILNGMSYCHYIYWDNISHTQIIGLFCLTGIGLIPWRIVDTYRPCFYFTRALTFFFLPSWFTGIIKIWYYKRRTLKLRKKAELPELYDKDDLPDPMFDPNSVRVLTDEEQYDLHHREPLAAP